MYRYINIHKFGCLHSYMVMANQQNKEGIKINNKGVRLFYLHIIDSNKIYLLNQKQIF